MRSLSLGVAIAAAAGAIVAAPAASAAPAVCEVYPANSFEALHASADPSSEILYYLSTGSPGQGCDATTGATYTECGGGDTWYQTTTRTGTTGYVRSTCVYTTA